MAVKEYIAGRGSASAAKIVNGVPGLFFPLGNLKSFSFGLTVETGENYETESIHSQMDASWTKKQGGKVELEFMDVNKANAKLLFCARIDEVAPSTATGEVLAAALPVVGNILTLKRGLASSVVIKDSSGAPKTLASGVNYAPRDGWMFGSADVLDVTTGGPFVAPIKADYSYGAQSRAVLLTSDIEEYVLRFEGVSKTNNRRILYEYWRAKFSPADKMDLISDEITAPKSTASLLADNSKQADGEFGQMGRMTYLGAPA